jgi:uncharacterized sporulation protein YeaH/YhbH (DUF444 family)
MHLRAPSPEVQHRGSTCRHRPADRARERHARDSERSPNEETGVASAGRLQALTDAEKDGEFEAEVSLFEDDNADIPELILSNANHSIAQMAKSDGMRRAGLRRDAVRSQVIDVVNTKSFPLMSVTRSVFIY